MLNDTKFENFIKFSSSLNHKKVCIGLLQLVFCVFARFIAARFSPDFSVSDEKFDCSEQV